MGWLDDTSGLNSPYLGNQGGAQYNAEADLTTKKFGSAAAKMNTFQTLGGGILINDAANWRMTSDSTIQCWFRVTTLPSETGYGSQTIWLQRDGSNINVAAHIYTDDRIRIYVYTPGGGYVAVDGSPSGPVVTKNVWHHIAISRVNYTYYLCYDGAVLLSENKGNYYFDNPDNTGPMAIGYCGSISWPNSGANGLVGWIDSFHIEVGVGRWSSGFNPETDPYSQQQTLPTAYSKILMNFNEPVYQIQGNLSDNARITIIDESSREVEYDSLESAGSYVISVSDLTEKTVLARRTSDGKCIAYGNVVGIEL